jgi:hypothetical protein
MSGGGSLAEKMNLRADRTKLTTEAIKDDAIPMTMLESSTCTFQLSSFVFWKRALPEVPMRSAPPLRYQSRTSRPVIDLDTQGAIRQLDLRSLGERNESR